MRIKKSDWTIVREAEEVGFVVALTGWVERNRTKENEELSTYFRSEMPNYNGMYNEEEGEEVLEGINAYISKHDIRCHTLDFPISSGTDVYLVPISENISLKVVVVDEYHGDGEYSKYVDINFFVMTEKTTKEDVDMLVKMVKEYIIL